jgi:hypothetical protein
MVKEAAKAPDVGRALIENEGLRNLGFTQENITAAQFVGSVGKPLFSVIVKLTSHIRKIAMTYRSSLFRQ